MPSGKRSPILRLTLASLLIALVWAAPARAAGLKKFLVPGPLTSAQFEQTLEQAHLPASERPTAEAAFDAYVEEWQRLRDRTLRPLRAELDLLDAQVASAALAHQGERPPSEATDAERMAQAEAFRQLYETIEATRATLRVRARQAWEQIGQMDARLLACLRAGRGSEEATAAMDALAQKRARGLAAAMIRSCAGSSADPALARLPGPPKGLDAERAAAFRERLSRLERDSLPLLKRYAATCVAEGEPAAEDSAALTNLVQLRLKALDELGAMLDGDAGCTWVDAARDRMMQGGYWGVLRAPRVAVVEAIGDRMDPAARRRLDRWTQERRAIENELLLGSDDWKFRQERTEALKQLDAGAAAELAESTRTPALVEESFARNAAIRAMRDEDRSSLTAIPGDDDGAFAGMQRRMEARMQAALGPGDQADAGGNPAMAAMQQRGLQRPQVDRIREALGVPADKRSVWDALAQDVLEASQTLHREKSIKPSDMNAPPQEAMAALMRMGEYRTQQQALEDRWFDSIAAALPEVPQAALADQRSRRALQRLRDLGGLARMVSVMSGDRSSDLDLDAPIDRLPPEARALLAPQVLAARERRTRELLASIEAAEALVRAMSKLSAGMDPNATPDPEQLTALMEEQRRFGLAAQQRAERAKADHQQEMEAMAAVLPKGAAAALRRMVRAQEFPEVYRDMERIDRSIERAMSLADLSTEQVTALGAESDAFRVRSDEIAERAITALTQAETAQSQLMTAATDRTDPQASMQRLADMTRSETAHADLEFDRTELSARTLRRLRALLTPAQVEAARLQDGP